MNSSEIKKLVSLTGSRAPAQKETEQVGLIVRESERAAQRELVSVLRLVDAGETAVSGKTRRASSEIAFRRVLRDFGYLLAASEAGSGKTKRTRHGFIPDLPAPGAKDGATKWSVATRALWARRATDTARGSPGIRAVC